MIDRVRKMLSLEADRPERRIRDAALSYNFPIQMNRGIKLHAGLGGPNFHLPPVRRIANPRGKPQLAGLAIQDEIVIVAARIRLQRTDARANRGGLCEIER